MVYAFPGAGALDYAPCTYGRSRLIFRGPRRDTARAFVSVIGGSEVYGKFVSAPFPDLLERELGMPVANFGIQNAGLDVFLNDTATLGLAAKSAVAILQIFGAANNSNRFYTVHPRRNDRLLSIKPALRNLYPNLDFTEFHFTRHLLHTLHHQSAERFETLATELRQVWVMRMRQILAQLHCPTILVWISDVAPPQPQDGIDLFLNPMLIDRTMIGQIAPFASHVVHAVGSSEAKVMGLEGMAFAPADLPSAAASLGPFFHREISDQLLTTVEALIAPRTQVI